MSTTFYDVLTKHSAIYPKMQPQDYLKLAYQSEFGCAHLLNDKEQTLSCLSQELDSVVYDSFMPIYTDIGGGFSRLNLSAVKGLLSSETIFRMIEKSCFKTGTFESFQKKLSLIVKSARIGVINTDYQALDLYFSQYDTKTIPSHSEIFKKEYGASYRVIKTEYAVLVPILIQIEKLLNESNRVNVAIDGCAAAGKSTIASHLSEILNADIIHTDDFFLPASKKTFERLKQPGGNIDYERFNIEVYEHLNDEVIVYNKFDCFKQKLSDERVIKRGKLLVVEGVYTLLPQFRDKYQLKIFVKTDSYTQRERIVLRGGTELYDRYASEWLHLEEIYFKALNPINCCDFKIVT